MLPRPPVAPAVGWVDPFRLGRDYHVRLDSSDYSVRPCGDRTVRVGSSQSPGRATRHFEPAPRIVMPDSEALSLEAAQRRAPAILEMVRAAKG